MSTADDNYSPEFPADSLARIVAQNRELAGLPPQSATFCCFKDPHSPRVCDRYRGHDSWHYDSTMPPGAIERNGVNLAIAALEREKAKLAGTDV